MNPAYERSFEDSAVPVSFRLPSRGNPIWRHVTRVGSMFSLSAGIAGYILIDSPGLGADFNANGDST